MYIFHIYSLNSALAFMAPTDASCKSKTWQRSRNEFKFSKISDVEGVIVVVL
jgi:hypothetical protein